MPTATKTRARNTRPAPEPEEVEEEAKDYTAYLEKAPTDLQERFAQWIQDATGYEPNDPDDFATGVQLATALRMEFQRSPENQAVLEERRAAAEAAKEERANKPAAKRGRPAKAKAVEEDVEEADEDVEEDEQPTPVTRRKATRAKAGATTKTASKPAAARTRRARPAAKAKDDAEAPF